MAMVVFVPHYLDNLVHVTVLKPLHYRLQQFAEAFWNRSNTLAPNQFVDFEHTLPTVEIPYKIVRCDP